MKVRYFVLLWVLFSPISASADQAGLEKAEMLLDSMKMESALDASIQQMLDIQLQQNPAMLPYKSIMLAFFKKHMSFASLKPDMARIYAKAFTEEELNDLLEFYDTPTGQKSIEVMPTLMAEGAMLGASRVRENAAELETMIQAEALRLQTMQDN